MPENTDIGSMEGSDTQTDSDSTEQSPQTLNPMQAEAERMARKYKVKVDGNEMEVDESELINNYQLSKAAQQRLQEGMQLRKQSEEFIRLLKTDPLKVLSHPSIGIDAKKWAEEYLISEMKKDAQSPEERQLEEYKAKLAKYEEQENLTKRQQEEQQRLEVRAKYTDQINREIIENLEVSGLPKTHFTVQRMVYYLAQGLSAGVDLSPRDVVDLVRRDYINDTKSLYSGLDSDALIKILGDDVAKKIRNHDLSKVKNPFKKNNIAPPPTTTAKKEKTHMTADEFQEFIANIK